MRGTTMLIWAALASSGCGGLVEPTSAADGGSSGKDGSTIGDPPLPAEDASVPPTPPTPPPPQPDAAPPPPPKQCLALGGKCVPGKFASCPAGTQPSEDIHADCMPKGASRGYFCCVPAPPSPCADSTNEPVDCFANGKCELCWSTGSSALACAGGRTCCAYTCPD